MRHFLLSALFVFTYALAAQNTNCLPPTPISVSGKDMQVAQIKDLLQANGNNALFDEQKIEKAIRNVETCNQERAGRLLGIENEISILTHNYQEVLSIRDVQGTKQQIEDLEKSKMETLASLEERMQRFQRKGLYIVFLPVTSVLTDVKEFQNQAKQSLTQRAIEEINGTSIRRISEVINQQDVSDIISSITAGEVTLDRIIYDVPDFRKGQEYYIYFASVNVTPLSKTTFNGISLQSEARASVFNPIVDHNYNVDLQSLGVDPVHITTIQQLLGNWNENIVNHNKNIDSSQLQIASSGEQQVREIDTQINNLREQLNQRSSRINQYCTEMGIRFDDNNLNGSAQRVLNAIQQQLQSSQNNWRITKDEEILFRKSSITISGNPLDILAEESIKLTERLRADYTKVTKNEEILDLEDYSVANYQNTRQIEFYRELNRVSVMCAGQANGSFNVVVFATFKIKDEATERNRSNNYSLNSTSSNYKTLVSDNFIHISGGTFQMGDQYNEGDDGEKPVHTVKVSNFYLSSTEVTFAEYDAFCTATKRNKPDDEGWGRSQRPAINVSWCDAVDYANWLSEQNNLQKVYSGNCDNIRANWEANGYRLPTEAEWEYAARQGGQEVRLGNGKDTAESAEINFDASPGYKISYYRVGTYRRQTLPVGSLNSPNSLGLHDMSGNVWEWCWDWLGDYPSSPQQNPRGPGSGSYRTNRGGSWLMNPMYCRSAFRGWFTPTYRDGNVGFRLARS
ncbi:SUMF1/EgtB/PvdO family nonheme iron enzyme [Lewinella sp. LCG006]|uniref:SUMF1/EgtB/PvdO family nonheme iron enzyme n=1 Tax=Lewinella sp. LCG006 TaxID=3231911 RepID=UPI00345FEA49